MIEEKQKAKIIFKGILKGLAITALSIASIASLGGATFGTIVLSSTKGVEKYGLSIIMFAISGTVSYLFSRPIKPLIKSIKADRKKLKPSEYDTYKQDVYIVDDAQECD